MKIFNKLIIFIAILIFSGCSDNISIVKNGVLLTNDSITVGDAIEKWKVCNSVKWSEFTSDNGRNIVEANCKIEKSYKNDIIKYYLKNQKYISKNKINTDKIKEIFVDFQFVLNINKDGFDVQYIGINLDDLDSLNLDILGTLEYVYDNISDFNKILNNTFESDVYLGKTDDELDKSYKEFQKDMQEIDGEMQELDNMFNDIF